MERREDLEAAAIRGQWFSVEEKSSNINDYRDY